MLTGERLRALMEYDPTTGILRWRVSASPRVRPGMVAGRSNGSGHLQIKIDRRNYFVHRLAWLYMTGRMPDHDIDHKNRVRSDNRWSNLRAASDSQNGANRGLSRNNATGFKGVHFRKDHQKFTASIRVSGRSKHLGYFDTSEAAHAAYVAAAETHFGEFARAA